MTHLRDKILSAIENGALEAYQLQGILLYRHLQDRLSDRKEAWALATEVPFLFFSNEIQSFEMVSDIDFADKESDDSEESIYWLYLRSEHMRTALNHVKMQSEEKRLQTQAKIENHIDQFMQLSYWNDLKTFDDGYAIMFSDYSSTFGGAIQGIDCYAMIKAYRILEELNHLILELSSSHSPS